MLGFLRKKRINLPGDSWLGGIADWSVVVSDSCAIHGVDTNELIEPNALYHATTACYAFDISQGLGVLEYRSQISACSSKSAIESQSLSGGEDELINP